MWSKDDVCRLCGGKSNMISVMDFQQKISYTLNIEVSINDARTTMCRICNDKLEDFCKFKSMCSLAQGRNLPSFIKVKEEPADDEPLKNKEVPSSSQTTFPSGAAMIFPTYFQMNQNGQFVSVPVPVPVVPLGQPIPFTNMGGLPFASTSINVSASPSTSTSVSTTQSNICIKEEKLDSDSSEDSKSIVDVINEIVADHDETTKSGVEGDNVEQKTDTICQNERNQQRSDSSDTGKAKTTPVSSSRKRKSRRQSTPPSEFYSTRTRTKAKMSGASVNHKIETSPVGRVTRTASGARLRKKIVSSNSSDEDFDGADIDDPAYGADSKQKTATESSSSDSSDEGKKKKKKRTMPKLELSAPSIVRNTRPSKEDNVKKSCPHCNLTYKHWVSYDKHVKTCEEEQKIKAEEAKHKPKEDEDDNDDDKERKCIVCLAKIIGTKALKQHMKVHQFKKGPPFQCKNCDEQFECKGGLICHNALHHRKTGTDSLVASDRKKLHCVECNETFQNSGDFICHQVLHHKKK